MIAHTLNAVPRTHSQNASAAAPDAPPTATRTIEGILFKALVDVGAVASINADDPKKVDLSRAARTDAGVSAAGNVYVLLPFPLPSSPKAPPT